MAFEQLRVQIAMLMDEIAGRPGDDHELQESLREKLAEMKALGLPLPDDLVELERALEEGFEEEEGQRRRRLRPTKTEPAPGVTERDADQATD